MLRNTNPRAKRQLPRPSHHHRLLALPILLAAAGCAQEEDNSDTAGLDSVEVVSLEMQRADGPAFLNERIPVKLTVKGASADANNPATELVPVMLSFVDADRPDDESVGCASASVIVEVPGNGEPTTVDAVAWPTTQCSSLVGKSVVLKAEVVPAGEQQLSVSKVFDQAVTLESSSLVDIEFAALDSESSVAVFPAVNVAGEDIDGAAAEDLESSLTVKTNLVLNGRDPYVAPVDADRIPEELKQSAPGIEEDLRFGRDDVGQLDDLPGTLTLRYEISAANDGETWMPMTIGTPEGRVPTVEVSELRPGLPNVLSHDLFLEAEAREAITDENRWMGEENYLVRGCFVTDFEQFRGESGPDGRCQSIPVVLTVNDGETESGVSSLNFDGGRESSFGNSRIGLEAVLQTRNAMNTSGVFSDTEARLTLKGKIGRSYSFNLVRGFSTIDAPLQGDKSVDMGLTLLGANVASFNREVADALSVEKDFSFSRSKRIVRATFGFGPVGVSFDLHGGGRVGLEASGQARLGLSEADCRPHLPAATSGQIQNRDEQIARIEAKLAQVDQRTRSLPPFLRKLFRRILKAQLLGRLRELGDLAPAVDLSRCVVLEASAGPSANLTATAFGGIDIKIAKAGIEADLDLAKLALPAEAKLALGQDLDNQLLVFGEAGLNLDFTPLSGRLALVGRVGFRRFSRSKSVTIVRFSTKTIRTNLLNRSMKAAEVIIP